MKDNNAVKKILNHDLEFFESQLSIFISELKSKNEFEYKGNNLVYKNICKNLIPIVENALTSKAKRIRPLFCYWILRCFSNNKENYDGNLFKTTQIALSIEILHNASLIIDDIEDGSMERREKTALHIQYGMPNALNAGSWMYFWALRHLPDELLILAPDALLECHIGQAIDLSSNEKTFINDFFFASSRERWEYYEKIVDLKTTRLILLSAQCLKSILKINEFSFDFIKNIVKKYGTIYQIFDDIKNLFPEFSGNKLNEDLKNGFRSAVSIEYLNLLDENQKENFFEKLSQGNFFEHIIHDKNLFKSVHNCFIKAEKMLHETSLYIKKHLGENNINALTILEIFQAPFSEIRKVLSRKINEKKLF